MTHRTDAEGAIGRLDPIDGEHVAATWSASDAKRALFDEITTQPVEPAPARRPGSVLGLTARRLKVAGALGVAAIALVVAQGVLTSPPAAFAVRPLPDGVLEVTVAPEFRDGDALAADLRSHGIDVEVRTVPSSPSQVGEVEIFGPTGGDSIPTGLTFGADGTPDVFTWKIDPDVFSERLTVEINVAARDGEPYVKSTSVFEEGEALAGLHCALPSPLRAAGVAPFLEDLGLTAIWFIVSPTGDPSITDSTLVTEVPDGEVLGAWSIDAKTVNIDVVLDGVTLGVGWDSRPSDTQCTAELASRWR